MDLATRLDEIGIQLLDVNPVGRGGSAAVYRARVARELREMRLPAAETLVAVKVFHSDILENAGQRERFAQEAHVGQLHDTDEIVKSYLLRDGTSGSPPFLVMEWVEGSTLTEYWKSRAKKASWEERRALAQSLVSALQRLHSVNVVHRDIKPDNFMVRVEGRPVLMDVGVAEVLEAKGTMHTTMGQFLGTVRYASPQYMQGLKYDKSDDVYSLVAT